MNKKKEIQEKQEESHEYGITIPTFKKLVKDIFKACFIIICAGSISLVIDFINLNIMSHVFNVNVKRVYRKTNQTVDSHTSICSDTPTHDLNFRDHDMDSDHNLAHSEIIQSSDA